MIVALECIYLWLEKSGRQFKGYLYIPQISRGEKHIFPQPVYITFISRPAKLQKKRCAWHVKWTMSCWSCMPCRQRMGPPWRIIPGLGKVVRITPPFYKAWNLSAIWLGEQHNPRSWVIFTTYPSHGMILQVLKAWISKYPRRLQRGVCYPGWILNSNPSDINFHLPEN